MARQQKTDNHGSAAAGNQVGATVVHWFRNDLRVRDNTGLMAASALGKTRGAAVVGLFVVSLGQWMQHDWSGVKVRFVMRCVRELKGELAKINVPLVVRVAKTLKDVPGVVEKAATQVRAAAVTANREYEIDEARRDERAGELLRAAGVRLELFHDQTAIAPGDVRTQTGGPYTVYTPFKKRWMELWNERGGVRPLGVPDVQEETGIEGDEVPIEVEGFSTTVDDALWPAGEREAERRLNAFVNARIRRYKDDRDFPAIDGTSTQSPYLSVGAISPRRCVEAALTANEGRLDGPSAGATHWISEVVWREFYRQVMVNFPRVCMHRAFKPETESIRWSDRLDHFEAWKEGRTGVPIVDAAMRGLKKTGWMHNRLRMIVAMYLTKDLFIDWRLGEKWFMQNLVDGDLAQNNGGWQWSASTGTDAAPYFRIFNPAMQSQKFDPEGKFIKRWVPELKDVEGDLVHEPWELPMLLKMGLEYPSPLVDRGSVKDRVLAAFKRS